MANKHEWHSWTEVERFYASPMTPSESVKMVGENIAYLYMGVTTIRFTCTQCSEIRKEEYLGKLVGQTPVYTNNRLIPVKAPY